MAHVRSDSRNLSTTYSAPEDIFEKIENHRFEKRKKNRSEAMTDLILKGLKYEALVQKRKAEKAI